MSARGGIATFFSGLSRSYGQLFVTRALVGIGEASYGPTASAMVSDLFPRERRGLVNGLFNAAIPLGGAIGVILGGLVGRDTAGAPRSCWWACRASRLTILAWRLGDPPRGGQDRLVPGEDAGVPVGFVEGVLGLFRTPTFVMVCAVGMLVAFAIGAFNHWLPLYLHRVEHRPSPRPASGSACCRRPGGSSAWWRAGSSVTCWRAGLRRATS